MKKRKAYKPRHASIPMLINREIHKNVETMEENAMILAFRFGAARQQHYDYLVRIGNMLNIANQLKPTPDAGQLAAMAKALTETILDRYNRTQKFGVSAADLLAMRELVKHFHLYWQRQTTTLYNECVAQLNAFYEELEQKRKVA